MGNYDFFPSASTFGHLLSGNFRVQIPQLQRPFAWKREQAVDFVNDIRRLVDRLLHSGPNQPHSDFVPHLFGTILLITAKGPQAPYVVIDGQQRITTVTITLSLIEAEARRLVEKIKDDESADTAKIRELLHDLIRKIHSTLWCKSMNIKDPDRPRIFSQVVTQKTYEDLLNGVPLEKFNKIGKAEPIVRLLTVANTIQAELVTTSEYTSGDINKGAQHLSTLADVILDHLLFVHISTPSQDTAYELFEVLNSRGEPLNAMDHLKTWIMAKMHGHPQREEVYDLFQPLTELEHGLQQAYLAHYFKARVFESFGAEDPKNNARTFRKRIFKDSQAGASVEAPLPGNPVIPEDRDAKVRNEIIEHTKVMHQWKSCYIQIRHDIWPYENMNLDGAHALSNLITQLNCKIAMPLLLQAANRLDSEEFTTLVKYLEIAFFRYKTICNGHAGQIEKVFLKIARQIDEGNIKPADNAKAELQNLLDATADDKTFALMLPEALQYAPGNKAQKVKYFLWSLERFAVLGKGAPVVDIKNYQVEHVSPQNPPVGKPYRNVHSLGNLCMLTVEEHEKLGNKSFMDKKKIIDDRKKPPEEKKLAATLSRELFDSNLEWTEELIDKRTQELVKRAVNGFRLLPRKA